MVDVYTIMIIFYTFQNKLSINCEQIKIKSILDCIDIVKVHYFKCYNGDYKKVFNISHSALIVSEKIKVQQLTTIS